MTKKKRDALDSDANSVPSQRNNTTSLLQNKQKRRADSIQVGQESRINRAKRNPDAQQGDKAEENADAARNLHAVVLPDLGGHSTKKSRNPKAVPNFDLQLTTLKRSRSPSPTDSTLDDYYDDELPLISEVWKQGNTASETDRVEAEGCEVPPPKRSRTDVSSSSSHSNKKVCLISSVSPC